MIARIQRTGLFALYQVTVALGIVLMPLALLARRAGITLPIGAIVEALSSAYEGAATE